MTKDQLTKIITEVLGERCPEHHEQCMTCAAWWMFDRLSDEPEAPRTDHAANLAKALEHYLNAHDTLSSIQDADEVTGQNDAIDGGFADKANDAWRGMRTALHHYRKHFPENRRAE